MFECIERNLLLSAALPSLVAVTYLFQYSAEKLDPPILLERIVPCCGNSWVVADSDTVITCGGLRELYRAAIDLKSVFELHKSGRVRALNDMHYPRDACGIVVWQRTVYVFGAMNGEGQITYERLLLNGNEDWELLGNMHSPRFLFIPVVWRQAIYLCGGELTRDIEVFDGQSLQLLPICFPDERVLAACVQGDSLLVFTYYKIVKFTVFSKNTVPVLEVVDLRYGCPFMSGGIAVYDNTIYCMSFQQVYQFNEKSPHFWVIAIRISN